MGRFSCQWAWVVALTGGCSVLIKAEPTQCEVTADCTTRGGEFENTECVAGFCREIVVEDAAPQCTKDSNCGDDEVCAEQHCVNRWACLSDEPDSTATGELTFDVPVATIFGVPLPEIPAKLCRSVDPSCETPLDTLESDENGVFHLSLPDGISGYYLEIVADPFFPLLYYFPSPLTPDTTLPVINLSPEEVIAGLGLAVGAALNPERGHILLSTTSCLGSAPGVRLSAPRADADSITYYVLDSVPSADLTATTEAGSGGFLNFPPGNATINLVTTSDQVLHTLSLTVRANFISSVSFNPAPQ